MTPQDDNHSAPPCSLCAMPMTLVRIDPRVASFAELHTFQCLACGDVRAIERNKTPFAQAVWPRSSFLR